MFRDVLLLVFALTATSVQAQMATRPVTPAPAATLAAPATDTVHLALPDAEQRFFQNNLAVLAQQFNVTVAQAQAIQARLIDNPMVIVEQNALNKNLNPEHFQGRGPGEVVVQVQQLFSIAGRRKAAGQVAQQGAVVEHYNLQDLLRTLRYQLRSTYFDLYYKQQSLKVYDTQIGSLTRTVDLYQTQLEKGNVALKEVVRLRAFLFQLKSEQQALLTDAAAAQTDLHVLLRDPSGAVFAPVVDQSRASALSLNGYQELQLVDTALVRRSDLNARQASLEQQKLNLRLQQKLAMPDVAVTYLYDKAGSYINDYNTLVVGMAVPIFNRNQGNIRAAKAQVAGGKLLVEQQQLVVQSEVRQAYQLVGRSDELFHNAERDSAPFARLIKAIEQSYARHIISVVEFIDFYDSYKNNVVQLNTLHANRMRAFEQLNFAVGKPVFRAE